PPQSKGSRIFPLLPGLEGVRDLRECHPASLHVDHAAVLPRQKVNDLLVKLAVVDGDAPLRPLPRRVELQVRPTGDRSDRYPLRPEQAAIGMPAPWWMHCPPPGRDRPAMHMARGAVLALLALPPVVAEITRIGERYDGGLVGRVLRLDHQHAREKVEVQPGHDGSFQEREVRWGARLTPPVAPGGRGN